MDYRDAEHDHQMVQLITSFQPDLFAYIRSLTLSPDLAEEVLQEANIVLWEKRAQFVLGTHFRSWAFQIARYKVLSLTARLNHVARLSDEMIVQLGRVIEQRSDSERDARIAALRACLAKLPPGDRELIERRYAGVSGRDAAAELKRPARAIYKAATRIRRSLMRCIQRRLAAEGMA